MNYGQIAADLGQWAGFTLTVLTTFWKLDDRKPDATRVAGLYAWNQLGRKVKKGERGNLVR